MAQRTQSVTLPDGRVVTGNAVEVVDSNERWNEYKLEDGTVFRAKLNVVDVLMVAGEVDAQGFPMLVVNAATTIAVISSPLKK